MWSYGKHGAIRSNQYHHQRQDRPEVYRENGAFYITSKGLLEASKDRASGNVGLYVMPRQRSFEIDEPADFEELTFLMKSGYFSSPK